MLLKRFLFCAFTTWTPSVWKKYPSLQIPTYPNLEKLEQVKLDLIKSPPLVFAGEIRNLKKELKEVARGKSFIFQAGPCAETFDNHNINEIKKLFTIIVQSSLIMSYGLEKKVLRIGRIAGQYAKPRSETLEKDNETLTYRGDIVHDFESRVLDPTRLKTAYYNSMGALNALRSFSKSGDLSLEKIPQWIPPLQPGDSHRYQDFVQNLQKSIQFVKNSGGVFQNSEPEFYTSHEALLLHYEEALTRRELKTGKWYNCGAHTLWLGERTRDSEAHIEYLAGIDNPIGIKVSHSANLEELVSICQRLNPTNEKGKITIVSRMGTDNINKFLPLLIDYLKESNIEFILMCDPCHGNTKILDGYKTRYLETILSEITQFFTICHEKNMVPGGIHVEISGSPLTECIGQNVSPADLEKNYQTKVDPRLNNLQTLETAFHVASLIN